MNFAKYWTSAGLYSGHQLIHVNFLALTNLYLVVLFCLRCLDHGVKLYQIIIWHLLLKNIDWRWRRWGKKLIKEINKWWWLWEVGNIKGDYAGLWWWWSQPRLFSISMNCVLNWPLYGPTMHHYLLANMLFNQTNLFVEVQIKKSKIFECCDIDL